MAASAMSVNEPATRAATRCAVLRDAARNQELEIDGVTCAPFLSPDEVAHLTATYLEMTPPGDHGLTVDYMRPDRDHVRRVMAAINETVAPAVDRTFDDHQIVMSTFVVKHPGEASQMFLHDDRSYVDERVTAAATMWIPLVDIGPDIPNGALAVVPKSHLLPTGWSGSHTPDAIRPYEEFLRRHLVEVEVTAGDAVIYNTRVLHASKPNLSDGLRIAVAIALAPADAPLLHAVATGRRERVLYRVNTEFFGSHHPRDIEQQMPADCPVVERVQDRADLTAAQILAALEVDGDPQPAPVVPADLAEIHGHQLPMLDALAPSAAPRVDTDLRLDETAPATSDAARATATIKVTAGHAWQSAVRRDGRSTGRFNAPIDRADDTSPDTDVVAMEPGARAELTPLTSPRWAVEFEIVECPTVGAGMLARGAAANANLGLRLLSTTNESVQLWNQGPGQLIVLMRRVPAPDQTLSTRLRGWLAQVLSPFRRS